MSISPLHGRLLGRDPRTDTHSHNAATEGDKDVDGPRTAPLVQLQPTQIREFLELIVVVVAVAMVVVMVVVVVARVVVALAVAVVRFPRSLIVGGEADLKAMRAFQWINKQDNKGKWERIVEVG